MRPFPAFVFTALLLTADLASATPIATTATAPLTLSTHASSTTLTGSTIFTTSGLGVTTNTGTGLLAGMAAYTPIVASTAFNPTTSVFFVTFGTFGTFNESGLPTLEYVTAASNSSSVDYLLLGTFYAGASLPGLGPSPGSINISFTENGNSSAGYSTSVSGTLAFVDAPAPTPEPSSLIFLGTGLLGVAFVARRKFSR